MSRLVKPPGLEVAPGDMGVPGSLNGGAQLPVHFRSTQTAMPKSAVEN